MESYRILYRIRIRHDYFNGQPCKSLECRLTNSGKTLVYRRGLLFRETAPDEWVLLFGQEPDTRNDELLLNLSILDPKFAIYTDWKGWNPAAAYELRLPSSSETVEAATAIQPTGKRRAIGSGFCTLLLRLTDEMVKAAEEGRPMQTVLHFEAAAAQWEYLFFHNRNEPLPSGQLLLEDRTGQLKFTAFEEQEIRGRKAWVTRTESSIRMCTDYPYRPRLTLYNEGAQKRVLQPDVPPPEPGQFLDVPKGILRQICHF